MVCISKNIASCSKTPNFSMSSARCADTSPRTQWDWGFGVSNENITSDYLFGSSIVAARTFPRFPLCCCAQHARWVRGVS